MLSLEMVALTLATINGFALVVKPVARFHARLDVLDCQLAQLADAIERIEKRLEAEK